MTTVRLDDEVVSAYRTDGVTRIRGLLDPDDVALATQGIEEVLARPSARAIEASAPDDPGRFVEDFCRWNDVAALGRLARHPAVGAAAAQLMGADRVRLFHDHVLVKEPGTAQRTPWHQDQPYYNVSGRQTVSFWIPVDPVPVDGSLEVVAGTHDGPWLLPRTFLDDEARWFPEGSLAELPDIDADRAAFPIRTWELEPGDAIAFHFLSVHGAAGFRGPGRRRVLSLRYVGDDARHAPRPWATSPEFPGLADELPDGAPLDHPSFPEVWPLSAGR